MFDVDQERLDDIARKYNITYSQVFDKIVSEKRKIFRREVKKKIFHGEFKNGIFYTVENEAYTQATNIVERYYHMIYNHKNNPLNKNNYSSDKELKKESINEIVKA